MAITEAQEVKAAAPSLHLHLHPYHWSSCSYTVAYMPAPQASSQTSGFTTTGCVASGSGEMSRSAKSPAWLAICFPCVQSAANAPLPMVVCMVYACRLREKEHHARISSKRAPFGQFAWWLPLWCPPLFRSLESRIQGRYVWFWFQQWTYLQHWWWVLYQCYVVLF